MSQENVSLDYVFSPFRKKEINPKDWDFKMNYWLDKIKKSLTSSDDIFINYKQLSEKFKHNGRPPHGLPEVFQEMINKKIIMPKSQFGAFDQNLAQVSWLGWGTETFIKYPLSYVNSWLNWYPSSEKLDMNTIENTEFIYFENFKKLSDKVWNIIRDKFLGAKMDEHGLYTFDQLYEACDDLCNNQETFVHIIKFLNKQGLLSFDSSGLGLIDQQQTSKVKNIIIKFPSHVETPEKPSFTEIDMNIMKLKQAEKILDRSIEKLSIDIDRTLINVKHSLQQQDKAKAKMHLKKKHVLQTQLEKREIARENIMTLLDQITHARSNKMIYEAYKSGIDAFKSTFEDTGMNMEKVNDTIDDIQEIVETQNEIDRAIASIQGPSSVSSSEIQELELELEELMKEEDLPSPSSLYPTLPATGTPAVAMPTVAKATVPKYPVPSDFRDDAPLDDSLEDLFPQVPTFEPGDELDIKKKERPVSSAVPMKK